MGYNAYGQLGLGDTTDRNFPVQVTTGVVAVTAGSSHTLFVKRDGTLWGTGDNSSGQLGLGLTGQRDLPVKLAGDVVALAGGDAYSLFVKRDGSLWAMGDNPYGELGQGDNKVALDGRPNPAQVFFRNSANQPTTALVVATLPKMSSSSHTLAITAPGP